LSQRVEAVARGPDFETMRAEVEYVSGQQIRVVVSDQKACGWVMGHLISLRLCS
jgi:hypothetical protein